MSLEWTLSLVRGASQEALFDSRVTRAAYSQSACYQNILGKTCSQLQPIGSAIKNSGSSLGCDTYALRPQQSEAFTIKEDAVVFYLALPTTDCPGSFLSSACTWQFGGFQCSAFCVCKRDYMGKMFLFASICNPWCFKTPLPNALSSSLPWNVRFRKRVGLICKCYLVYPGFHLRILRNSFKGALIRIFSALSRLALPQKCASFLVPLWSIHLQLHGLRCVWGTELNTM